MVQLRFLDHVALKVSDLERSAQWYEQVLGLKRYPCAAWDGIPLLLLAGQSGLALFPVRTPAPQALPAGEWLRVTHFAFNVDQANFQLAQQRLQALKVPFECQDHHYFHSIYLADPDGHQVELTTLVVNEAAFYT